METRWGKLLGRYEIVAEVGRGGMGIVYKARDPKIDRFVAIKTVSLAGTGDQQQREFRSRFFVEAQAAGRLLHPGIVTVFDMGEEPDTGYPYIVMEYIEGRTLREVLDAGKEKLPLDTALQIAEEVAEALDYAHAQGVVHRDIKPENILITNEGQAKIGDFGIAQLDLSHMTLPGRVIGTPAYMSPEQLEGLAVDGRSDLFSLGAVFYTLLTGFSPFQGSSATTVCFKVANRDPLHATVLSPELPQELDAVLERALAKDPADRYQRGMELALDLRELRQTGHLAAQSSKGTLWFAPGGGRRAWLANAVNTSKTGISSEKKKVPTRASTSAATHPARQTKGRSRVGLFAALLIATFVLALYGWRKSGFRRPAAKPVVAHAAQSGALPVQSAAMAVPAPAPVVTETMKAAAGTGTPKTAAAARTRGDARATASSPVPRSIGSSGGTPEMAPAASTKQFPNQRTVADSNLQIVIENPFQDATLVLWVDSELIYSHPLHEGRKRRLMSWKRGGTKETITIPVFSGKHQLRVKVRSQSAGYDETQDVLATLSKNGEATLSIGFARGSNAMTLSME